MKNFSKRQLFENLQVISKFVVLYYTFVCLFVLCSNVDVSGYLAKVLPHINSHSTVPVETHLINSHRAYYKGNHQHDQMYIMDEGRSPSQIEVTFWTGSLEETNVVVYHYFDVYTNAAGKPYFENKEIDLYPDNYLHQTDPGDVVNFAEHLICIGNLWTNVYGHFLFDSVLPLYVLPKFAFDTAQIVLPIGPHNRFYQRIYNALGIESHRIIEIKRNQYVYARNFYTVKVPSYIHGCLIHCLNRVSDIVRKKFDVDQITPTFIGIGNRQAEKPRYFIGIDEFYNKCVAAYPNEAFTKIKPTYISFQKCVLDHAVLKLLFGPTGSNMLHMTWMKQGTGVVFGMGESHDGPALACAEIHHIWAVSFYVPGMQHFIYTRNYIDHELVFKAFNKVLYAIQHQRWP